MRLYLCYCLFLVCVSASIYVKTKNGIIRGTFKTSRKGKEFTSFEGVPYGEAPIGEKRFMRSEAKKPWKGIWDASIVYECLQMRHSSEELQEPVGTEDCLYLNIYSPKINEENATMDVLIHFHSGAFMYGSAHYWGPHGLMDYNVVFVGVNYRLGPLGFLSTQDDVLPGNNGLKDQNLAIKWVKENIHHFGGNPDSITLTGLSAGGASVHFHYLSPLSKGLFQRGISASGTALSSWALAEHPLQKTRKLGKIVGCEQQSSQELVDCLRQRSGKQIVQAVKKFQPWLYNPSSPFGPVVEPKTTSEKGESFLPDLPYNLLKNGEVADVEWITSVTSDEGLYPVAEFLYKAEYLRELEENWVKLFPFIMHYDGTVDKNLQNEVSKKIKDYYLKGKPITKETLPGLVQAISDRHFVVDAVKAAQLQSKVNKSPVYFYKFSYRGDHSLSESYGGTTENLGVSHADDVMYIIEPDHSWFEKYLQSEGDQKLANILINMWISFAKSGKPKIKGVKWPRVSRNLNDKLNFVHFISPDNIVVEDADDLGYRSFWDSLPIKENNLIVSVKDEL